VKKPGSVDLHGSGRHHACVRLAAIVVHTDAALKAGGAYEKKKLPDRSYWSCRRHDGAQRWSITRGSDAVDAKSSTATRRLFAAYTSAACSAINQSFDSDPFLVVIILAKAV